MNTDQHALKVEPSDSDSDLTCETDLTSVNSSEVGIFCTRRKKSVHTILLKHRNMSPNSLMVPGPQTVFDVESDFNP